MMALQLSSLKFQHITQLKRLSRDQCDSVACSDKKVDGKPVNTRLYLFAFAMWHGGPLKQNIFKRATLALKMPQTLPHSCLRSHPKTNLFRLWLTLLQFQLFHFHLCVLLPFFIYLALHFWQSLPHSDRNKPGRVFCSSHPHVLPSALRGHSEGGGGCGWGVGWGVSSGAGWAWFLLLDLFSCQRRHEVRGREWLCWLKRLASC